MSDNTVLIVEDDDAFRYATARHLTDAGLRVVEAKDTMDALKRVEGGLSASCLIADIQMPAGVPHGLALAKMLRARAPRLIVIFVTAYPELATATNELWDSGSVFLKPVDLQHLATEVQRRLTTQPS